MAAAATECKQEPPANSDEQPSSLPPTYYMTTQPTAGLAFDGTGLDGTHVSISESTKGPNVVVTQPVVVASASPPDTTLPLIMSTISAVLCGFWCGAAGILLAWKAKLLVLEKKYEHARHSLRIVWLFFSLAVMFGLGIWIVVGTFIFARAFRYFW